jgi:hypothetical protein
VVERRGYLPPDVEAVVAALEHAVSHRMHQTAPGDDHDDDEAVDDR